jgi:alpha-galactosidase
MPTWERAHFGAWCIISAPLILGLPLTDARLAPVLDFIGNAEAIAINQAWAGHPGMLVEEVQAGEPDSHAGGIGQPRRSLAARAVAPIAAGLPVPAAFDGTDAPQTAHHHLEARHAPEVMPGAEAIPSQLWAKPQPAGGVATLLINTSPLPLRYSLLLAKLNLTAASYSVRDVWARQAHPASPASKAIDILVAPNDSSFLLLSPVEQLVV